MIAALLKNWKLLLDILLVVGGVILFTLFDPLGIFKNSQTQQTANLVSGVRSIGQLITAEYYGEVMSSWKDYQLNEFPEDTLIGNEKMLYLDLMQAFRDTDQKFKKLYPGALSAIRKDYPDEFFGKFLIFMGSKKYNLPLRKIYDEKESKGVLKKNAEEKIVGRLYTEIKGKRKSLLRQFKNDPEGFSQAYEEYLSNIPDFVEGFMPFYYSLTQKHLQTRPGQKNNIVFIGRGWVKAGFDFGGFDEHNFQYDAENKTVHFFGLKPQILDTDINPWFIPQLKVKGFELVDYSKGMDFEQAKKVKHQCKLDLLEKARESNIIGQAQSNGEETLQSFFALVLDEPDLKVAFHLHPFDQAWAMLSSDTLIDLSEALYIDSLYQHELALLTDTNHPMSLSLIRYRKEQFREFIHKLKTLSFIQKDFSFNYFSMSASRMLHDSWNISKADRDFLVKIRDTLSTRGHDPVLLGTATSIEHSIWFDGNYFLHDFNHGLQVLDALTLTFDSSVILDAASARFSENNEILIYDSTEITNWDTLPNSGHSQFRFTYQVPYQRRRNLFVNYKYDLLPFSVLKESNVNSEMELKQKLDTLRLFKRGIRDMLTLHQMERDTLNSYILSQYAYQKKTTPIKKFTLKLNQLFAKTKN